MQESTPLQNHAKPPRWGNYVKEFILIFLAITLGFFVENYREDLAEKDMVKGYMQELVGNLEYDTIRCQRNLDNNQIIFRGLDSLRKELKAAIEGKVNTNQLYYLAFKYPGRFSRARFNNTAMSELKNSGSIRLIENKELVNHLGDYYQRKIFAAESYEPPSTLTESMEAQRQKLFSMRYLDRYLQAYEHIDEKRYDPDFNRQMFGDSSSIRLLTSDTQELETYLSMVTNFEIRLRYYCFWLDLNKKTAMDLISEINQEYRFTKRENAK